jgi:5-hydroxyisourate hydrolase
MKLRSPITTHILDTSKGLPAKNVAVTLEYLQNKNFTVIAVGKTNQDGRIEDLLEPGSKALKGTYRLTFETGKYYKKKTFYPYATIVFEIKNINQHYHVPLLLNPYGLSTYRGS